MARRSSKVSRRIGGLTGRSTCSGRGRTPPASTAQPNGWRWLKWTRKNTSKRSPNWSAWSTSGFPTQPGASLYIRPTLIATDIGLGVHASHNYLHFIIVGPAGPYFATGFDPVAVYISRDHVRAVRGGTGAAKAGGNYAASLFVAEKVKALGYQQVLWLDAVDRRYVEEVGAMNIAFVYDGTHIATPALSGSILPGITRDSVLRLAPDLGYTVSEERIDVDQALADIRSGRITEVFGIGTAAVIAPVGTLGSEDETVTVNDNQPGPVARRLYDGADRHPVRPHARSLWMDVHARTDSVKPDPASRNLHGP